MSESRQWNLSKFGLCCLLLVLPGSAPAASETNGTVAEVSANPAENSASNDAMRAYLQLQEQVHATQLAIERTRQESEDAATKNAAAFADQLRDVERSLSDLSDQRTRESHFMVEVMSVFAGVAFLAVIMTAYFQWRTVNRLADFATAIPAGVRALGPGAGMAALDMGENPLITAGPIEQSNGRLLGAIERLEKRILELEHVAMPSLNDHPNEANGVNSDAQPRLSNGSTTQAVLGDSEKTMRIKALLDKGQALLNEDKNEEAVASLDEALVLDPNNAEALLKKGAALEKMRRLQEAVEYYDRAIAADGSMTIAYLYKGGLYNRMERFSEAVECYEQALHTQEKKSTT